MSKIKCAQIHHREIVQRVIDAVKFKSFVPRAAFADERCGALRASTRQILRAAHPAPHRVPGSKSIKIAEHESKRVADFAVRFRQAAASRFLTSTCPRCNRATPPTGAKYPRPICRKFRSARTTLPQRLRHRPALLVQRPAIREHIAIGSRIVHAFGHQQRTVEPSAKLIGPFQIHVRGPRQIRRAEHGKIRGSRIKPNVENVIFLTPLRGAAGTLRSRGKQVLPPNAKTKRPRPRA